MFESILHGIVVGLVWVGVWRFFDLVYDIRKISRSLEELVDVMRSYQTDLSRFDLLLFDLISEVAGDKVDPSFVERERDDFYRSLCKGSSDWPVDDTMIGGLDDEA